MTDSNQAKFFRSKKNKKLYIHWKSHCSNERRVCKDIYLESFKKRYLRAMSKSEHEIFQTAFNMGYKEGINRIKEKKK